MVQNILESNPSASIGTIQVEVQKEFSEKYAGMRVREWYDLIKSYMSIIPLNDKTLSAEEYPITAEDIHNEEKR